jgi:hypothetical protein
VRHPLRTFREGYGRTTYLAPTPPPPRLVAIDLSPRDAPRRDRDHDSLLTVKKKSKHRQAEPKKKTGSTGGVAMPWLVGARANMSCQSTPFSRDSFSPFCVGMKHVVTLFGCDAKGLTCAASVVVPLEFKISVPCGADQTSHSSHAGGEGATSSTPSRACDRPGDSHSCPHARRHEPRRGTAALRERRWRRFHDYDVGPRASVARHQSRDSVCVHAHVPHLRMGRRRRGLGRGIERALHGWGCCTSTS